ncbi:uncharacterized protein LOC108670624 [Hyalella azteca]|uniref:Uncharacterized protein LOC108670624 n=1 Tax=Hyalella azteca TaxID=294128 RepID=A0A979FN04_HYAAZ|nr:uncharacterized protein LOC108670624 [Hyalella azteca]
MTLGTKAAWLLLVFAAVPLEAADCGDRNWNFFGFLRNQDNVTSMDPTSGSPAARTMTVNNTATLNCSLGDSSHLICFTMYCEKTTQSKPGGRENFRAVASSLYYDNASLNSTWYTEGSAWDCYKVRRKA